MGREEPQEIRTRNTNMYIEGGGTGCGNFEEWKFCFNELNGMEMIDYGCSEFQTEMVTMIKRLSQEYAWLRLWIKFCGCIWFDPWKA